MGVSVQTCLAGVEPGQSFLLCVGEQKNTKIPGSFWWALQNTLQCQLPFNFNTNFYIFLQTTVFNTDMRSAKDLRVKELRERLLYTIWGDIYPWMVICKAHHTCSTLLCQHLRLHHGLYPRKTMFEMWTAEMFIILHLVRFQETHYSFPHRHCCDWFYWQYGYWMMVSSPTDTPVTTQLFVDNSIWCYWEHTSSNGRVHWITCKWQP